MSAAKDRHCVSCGGIEHMASRSSVCKSCFHEAAKEKKRKEEMAYLEDLGYLNVSGCSYNTHGKPVWSFIHADCGTEQSWVFSNVLKQRKARPTCLPCSRCGGESRMANARTFFMAKYGITPSR